MTTGLKSKTDQVSFANGVGAEDLGKTKEM